jgi:hypothetical protein
MKYAYYIVAPLLLAAITFQLGYFKGKSESTEILEIMQQNLDYTKSMLNSAVFDLDEQEDYIEEVFQFIDNSDCAEDIHQEMYDAD